VPLFGIVPYLPLPERTDPSLGAELVGEHEDLDQPMCTRDVEV